MTGDAWLPSARVVNILRPGAVRHQKNVAHIGEPCYSVHNHPVFIRKYRIMSSGTPREVRYPPTTLRARKSLLLNVSKRQSDILIGCILGDAYIAPQGKIQIEHSYTQHDYIAWKKRELDNLSYDLLSKVKRFDARTQRVYTSERFWLRQYFRPWRSFFYPKGKKIFPSHLQLTPLSLAVWYMDDGCLSDRKCTLSTESFSHDDQQSIQRSLRSQFHLQTFIRSNGKIGISQQSQRTFFSIIGKHVHESMAYKIP